MTLKLLKNNIYHNKRIEEIAYKLNIDEKIVDEVISIMYDYIKTKLEGVEIDEDKILSKEEFDEKFPIIHIPSLGYIYPNYRKYVHIMNNTLKKKNGKNK